MNSPSLVAFAGSTRRGSFNRAILATAAAAAERAGASVDRIDLGDCPLPLFDQDLEASQGLPDAARELKRRFLQADGFILASPEYNSSLSPLMKNVIDWCSRSETEDEPPLAAYDGKSALLLAASPGPLGGLRGLHSLRAVLQNIGVTVHPDTLAVRSAHERIEDGELVDDRWRQKVETLAEEYVGFAARLAN